MLVNGQDFRFTHERRVKDGFAYWFQKKGFPLNKLGVFQTPSPFTLEPKDFERLRDAHQRQMRMVAVEPDRVESSRLKPGTLGQLISMYRQSDEYKTCAPTTRKYYEYTLRKLELLGHLPMSTFTPAYLYQLFLKAKTHGAKHFLKVVLRQLFKIAVKMQFVEHNYAADIEVKKPSKRRRVWTGDEFISFLAIMREIAEKRGNDPDEIETMLFLLRWQGQRPSDLLGLIEANYVIGRLRFRQEKTKRHEEVQDIDIPVHMFAKIRLDNWLKKVHTKRLPNAAERIFSIKYHTWREIFAEAREQLGFAPKQIQTRDLRRTLASNLAEGGATESEIASITGHSQKSASQILETYIVKSGKMADNAMAKIGHTEQAENGRKSKVG